MKKPVLPQILHAPAKVNLFLRITGSRPDGYHELQSLMCPIDLQDTIELGAGEEGIRVRVEGGGGQVPETEENLAFRAARAFFRAAEILPALDIRIEKKIPVAAGLGGGSSDAAAVLKGLNQAHGEPLSQQTLLDLGLGLGADVPFFLSEGAAWAEGIGERLERFRNIFPLPLVLVNPGVPLRTAEVYKNLKWGLTKEGIKTKKPHFEEALMDPLPWLFNDLEPVAMSMCAEVGQVRQALEGFGALGVLMSGSGPTVFGFFSGTEEASKAAFFLSERHPAWLVLATRLVP
ncbi:4-(cytidine 5'-diphospho)-2-C-methyl-D-erythritol kinase [Desulfobotulus sp.]|uniref:4-(cytidine 5'-diphospho)-2-C-methyl-D-erythritol kinase n=1 Tax=Desulfobotulus sp. TaxID=1940337 RepID=UPI002A35BA10|nr:4-(cytidine 5'-diphospho)-2-C-methyl-D-erythritol kinase [Desulfobotulus sp.]MDY0164062.1 4-(cytidine 5'-diphospho)-2-C-methyl-D-erythritol kinase [Desulfobotulus sp.]